MAAAAPLRFIQQHTHIEAWAKKVLPDFQFRIAASYILLRHFKLRVSAMPHSVRERERASQRAASLPYVCLLAGIALSLSLACYSIFRAHAFAHTPHTAAAGKIIFYYFAWASALLSATEQSAPRAYLIFFAACITHKSWMLAWNERERTECVYNIWPAHGQDKFIDCSPRCECVWVTEWVFVRRVANEIDYSVQPRAPPRACAIIQRRILFQFGTSLLGHYAAPAAWPTTHHS